METYGNRVCGTMPRARYPVVDIKARQTLTPPEQRFEKPRPTVELIPTGEIRRPYEIISHKARLQRRLEALLAPDPSFLMRWFIEESDTVYDREMAQDAAAHAQRMNPKVEKVDPNDEICRHWFVIETKRGYAVEDPDYEGEEPDEEDYNDHQPMNKDRVEKEGRLIKQPINYMGIAPGKIWKAKEEKKYWIGRIYIQSIAAGRGAEDISQEICDYFGIGRATLFRYVDFTKESDEKGRTIKGTKIRVKRATPLTGEWGLKKFIGAKYIVPWTTCDGFRTLGLWGIAGPIDKNYMAKSIELRQIAVVYQA